MFSSGRLRVCLLLLSAMSIGQTACRKKIECTGTDIRLNPGQRVFLGTQSFVAGSEPCCVAIRDGKFISDCPNK